MLVFLRTLKLQELASNIFINHYKVQWIKINLKLLKVTKKCFKPNKINVFNSSSKVSIRGIGGGLWGLPDPPETQKSQKATPPETPLKSSGIATTLKPQFPWTILKICSNILKNYFFLWRITMLLLCFYVILMTIMIQNII